MQTSLFRRGVSLALSLATVLSVGLTARAAQPDTDLCTCQSVQVCTQDCPCGCGLIHLVGTDALLPGGTEYLYTGEEVRPAVTVTVDDTVLTENEHYTLTYANNIAVGTGTVTITGIETAGYTGTIELPFTIAKAPGTPEFTLVEIKGTDVVMEGTEFAYTGQAIEPAVTVTVNGTVLTPGTDYRVTYTNNVQPGTATMTVTGIATASDIIGYTGTVSMDFTIKAQEPEQPSEPSEPSQPTQPSEPSEPSRPTEPSEPSQPTQPSEPPEPSQPTTPSQPEEDDKEEPFDYKIIKGSGGKWRQDSGKNLSFTINAHTDDITAIRIDGKKLNQKHYTLKKDVITLENSWLQEQDLGTYRITVEFEDGDAQGKFLILRAADESNPKTGDIIGIWFSLMGLSVAGAAALLILGRKKIFK